MQVLVVGGGGREHALCWKLAQSPRVEKVWVAPGNAGCARHAERVDIQPNQIDALVSFVHARKIDLTVVGPEEPLVLGLTDRLEKLGYKVFGPSREAARLEGSKSYAKALARQHNIPGPDFKVFLSSRAALDYLERAGEFPLVVKADGLAGGKGVRVCASTEEAREHILDCFERRRFGAAGEKVVIEEFVRGSEASVMMISSASTLLVLEPARDYKRAYDGDLGPNTGGMGAVSPSPISAQTMQRIEEKVLVPTVHAMVREGHPFRGVLYAGLMLTPAGPRLLEYNVRFGDPETQPTLMRLRSDLFEVLLAAVEGKLDEVTIEWDPRPAITVVVAAEGYPGSYRKGAEVHGLDDVRDLEGVEVFHAGTEHKGGKVITTGGRVLNVTAIGDTLAQARARAYAAIDRIRFEGMFFRTDIGADG